MLPSCFLALSVDFAEKALSPKLEQRHSRPQDVSQPFWDSAVALRVSAAALSQLQSFPCQQFLASMFRAMQLIAPRVRSTWLFGNPLRMSPR
jgi:hypothetical protein